MGGHSHAGNTAQGGALRVVFGVSDEDGLGGRAAAAPHGLLHDLPFFLVVQARSAAHDHRKAVLQTGALQQQLRHILRLGGGDAQPQPRGGQALQQAPDAREGSAFIDPHGHVAFPEVRHQGLRLRPIHPVDLHEFIHQGRPGKAAQPLQRLFASMLAQGVLDAFRNALHGVENGPVKVKEHGFQPHGLSPVSIFCFSPADDAPRPCRPGGSIPGSGPPAGPGTPPGLPHRRRSPPHSPAWPPVW